MTKQQAIEVLSCGHQATPIGYTPGYALDLSGKRICYDCCGVRDKEEMLFTGKAVLYYTDFNLGENPSLGNDSRVHGEVTNWCSTLHIKVYCRPKIGRHNFAGVRYDIWFGFAGSDWHGVVYGNETQLCHIRRIKNDT